MAKYFFLLLIFVHGLIHTIGFLKAFHIIDIDQLSKEISRPQGVVWLLTAILLLISAFLFLYNHAHWIFLAFIAVVISQVLIISTWSDAKFGTIANLMILIPAVLSYATTSFAHGYQTDVQRKLVSTENFNQDLLSQNDLESLPALVQNYILRSGAVNKPKVHNVKIIMQGEMRGKDQDWFHFASEQYNFFDEPTRLFFMKANVKGLPTYGYHTYSNKKATMLIKVLGLIPIINKTGSELDVAETVTVFNDMCLFAPSTLIDSRIRWQDVDSRSVKATFKNGEISISATLHFDDEGRLQNFVSDDRYDVAEMKQYRFSTPIGSYQFQKDHDLCSYGEAIWHYPDGEFTYGKFQITSVEYNVGE
jgi:hypothetical protein